jgi:RND superfamily putative drug exporter
VPAIAALVGRASWWPSQPWLPDAAEDDAPEKKTVFDAVTEN